MAARDDRDARYGRHFEQTHGDLIALPILMLPAKDRASPVRSDAGRRLQVSRARPAPSSFDLGVMCCLDEAAPVRRRNAETARCPAARHP